MAELISNQKNFKQCAKLLIGGIEKLVEWSDQTRRPLLIIYEDEGGLSHTGTKNMRERAMLNGTTGWEMCARLDTILLNSEDPEESSNARAIRPENKSLAKICNMQALPLLPLPLEQMNGKELGTWFRKQAIRDITETTGQIVKIVEWGKGTPPSF